jgi:hypothetical protein
MGSPIYEALKADFDDAVKSAESRGRMELSKLIVETIKPIARKTVAMKRLLEIAEQDLVPLSKKKKNG